MISDAGMVASAVPTDMLAMGRVARDLSDASICPASPPTVMISTEAVWNSAWQAASVSTFRFSARIRRVSEGG